MLIILFLARRQIDLFTLENTLRADNFSITDKKRGPKVSAIERFYCNCCFVAVLVLPVSAILIKDDI